MKESNISLNPEQKKAVEHTGGPLLVVAGAGTGKTRVLIERIRWLVEEKKVNPSQIAALTFTEKAAREMSERLDLMLPLSYEEPQLSTFHGFAERILRDEALEIGLEPSYKILPPPRAWLFIRRHLFEFDLKYYLPLGNPTKFISAMLALFSRAQDEDVSPQDYLAYIGNLKNPKSEIPSSKQIQNSKSKIQNDAESEEVEKQVELANAYQTYQNLKIKNSFMDFGDLIGWTLKLFRERPSILKKYQERFRYLLIDEFQDTNYAQYQLVKLLAPSERNPQLLVTGDDDQSVYKFRGASVSNILEFKKDYPLSEVVVLSQNYRSTQPILDAAYSLIQNNNPDRLEVKLAIGKKITGTGRGLKDALQPLLAQSGEEEADLVLQKIISLKPDYEWRDFAVLARANSHLDPFVAAFKRHEIPYQLVGNRGLFEQSEVRDVLSLLRFLVDQSDSASFYRLLTAPIFGIEGAKVSRLLNLAQRVRQPLWEVFQKEEAGHPLTSLLSRFIASSLRQSPSKIIYALLHETGYIKPLLDNETVENQLKIKNLNLFLEKVKAFEAEEPGAGINDFVNYLDMLIEAGENPAQAEIEDIDTVNLLTVHSSKGLEFRVVFLVSLTSDRFPTRDRKDALPLPDKLIKETLPEGDEHLQEERRLFYVGATRARERIFLSFAENYGGTRLKKISPFVKELGLALPEGGKKTLAPQLSLFSQKGVARVPRQNDTPKIVSYSQLETFAQCPLKYKYRYVLGIPTPPEHVLSFGQSVHRALRDFHRVGVSPKSQSLDHLLRLFETHFLPEGYESREHRERRLAEGKEMLERYFATGRHLLGEPLVVEKRFNLGIGATILVGSIDRIDRYDNGAIEIVDYKTGGVATQKEVDRDAQLTIYALAATEALNIAAGSLSLFFVQEGQKITTTRSGGDLAQKKEDIAQKIDEIKRSDFAPKVGPLCRYCSYRQICPAYRPEVV